jgi:diguanylate cyclase (GGDEF)-like protein/PAS domain S-box-containing protein
LTIKVLLLTPDPTDADFIQNALNGEPAHLFELQWVHPLTESLAQFVTSEASAVLLMLSIVAIHGMAVLDKLLGATPRRPVLVLGHESDEDIARLAVLRGADDYLLTQHINQHTLPRAIRSAVSQRATENALLLERNRAQVALNAIGDAVISTDISGNVTHLNSMAEKMTGWSAAEALGRPLTEVFQIIEGTTRRVARNPVEHALKENKLVALSADCVLIRRDGAECAIEDSATPVHDPHGQIAGAVIVFHDVSESRAMRARMSHLALHDALTDLPNRTLLNDRVTQAIALARRHGKQFAVLFVDVDGFKRINDTLGHTIGDRLLCSIAERLSACVRATDTLGRLGGDEFVALLSEIEHARDAIVIADHMRVALAAPYHFLPNDIKVTASIGVSVYPYDALDAETLFKNADMALYYAKKNGRDNSQFFKPDMNHLAVEQRTLEVGLRAALERGEFALHYQPTVDLKSGAVTGAEALLRWRHPIRGVLLPELFIPVAEKSQLIVPIGQWVLREACKQGQAWSDSGLKLDQIAVNISAVEFQSKGFLENIKVILEETGFDPHRLELELTESVLMQNAESTAALLDDLKAMGVRLAIDDFGTGYSSLSYLSRFPIDTLKIDQSFVRETTHEATGKTIVSAIINLGKNLNHRLIAEGVETPEQLAFLQSHSCDEGQGYHFSRPVGADAFAAMLSAGLPGNAIERATAQRH